MGDDGLHLWTIKRLGAAYRSKEISPVEVLQLLQDRINRLDHELQSFITLTPDLASAQARQATSELAKGIDRGPLHGVPISLKDLIEVEAVRTTGGSRLLENNISTTNSAVVHRLNEAGAVLLGKNSTYEFGIGLPKAGDWASPACNPWDLSRIPGGSSSGSAAAVFSGLSFGAFGTDTGGSIRGPAAYCGLVGYKPTRGLIGVEGVLPLSSTLDHVGPLARTVEDVRALLAAASVSQYDPPTEPYALSGVTIGVPESLINGATYGPGIVEDFNGRVELLESVGVNIQPVEFPVTEDVETALRSIVSGESYQVHASTLSSRPDAYGPSTFERLSGGLSISVEDSANAHEFREVAIEHMDDVFGEVDWIISPVTHTTAPTFADYEMNPTPRTLFTGLFNLTGAPAISIPSGLDASTMPIGFQVAGPSGSDNRLLNAAASIEALFEFPSELSVDAARLRST